jgi:hypothetical protein
MEIWPSMKIMKKDHSIHRGHKLMVRYSQMLVTMHSFALFLHWQVSAQNEIEYVEISMFVEQSMQNEIEYVK